MILAGIQPSAVWFRVLQGMAAPACDQLCGGCLTLSLCPTAAWSVDPASRHRHRVWGKDAEARGLFGKAQQGCYLCPCLLLGWQLTGEAWAWAGTLQSFLVAQVGLQFPATAHFGVNCSSNATGWMAVLPRAVLCRGQGAARRGDFAGPVKLKAARPSGLPLACVTSMAASSQGQTRTQGVFLVWLCPEGRPFPPAPSPNTLGQSGPSLPLDMQC